MGLLLAYGLSAPRPWRRLGAGVVSAVLLAAASACGPAETPDRELIVVSPEDPLPITLSGLLECESEAVVLCLDGTCAPSTDTATVRVDFDAARLEVCSEGDVDVCEDDAILGHLIESGFSGVDVVHLHTRRSVFSVGYEEARAGGDFVLSAHALRSVITMSGTCAP